MDFNFGPDRSPPVRGKLLMMMDQDLSEPQEIDEAFMEAHIGEGEILARMVQAAGEDAGFGTTYTCWVTGTPTAVAELVETPVKRARTSREPALVPCGGNRGVGPKGAPRRV